MDGFKGRWGGIPRWLKVVLYVVLGAAGTVVLGFFFGYLVEVLWNWLMPELFGLKEIGFWQAAGLFILARFLFGGFGRHDNDSKPDRHRKRDRCEGEAKGDFIRKEWQSWRHYDEWWGREGKQAFREYADRMNAEPGGHESPEDRAD